MRSVLLNPNITIPDNKNSYSSVDVAIAGLDAKRQVVSQFSNKDMKRIKQGVVNLLTLLQARYKKPEQKRHLAILFTFIEVSLHFRCTFVVLSLYFRCTFVVLSSSHSTP